jgi:hypothetical protein
MIVQERQQAQIQPIPKSLRAGEKGRFDDQNNIALLPPQGRMKLRISR